MALGYDANSLSRALNDDRRAQQPAPCPTPVYRFYDNIAAPVLDAKAMEFMKSTLVELLISLPKHRNDSRLRKGFDPKAVTAAFFFPEALVTNLGFYQIIHFNDANHRYGCSFLRLFPRNEDVIRSHDQRGWAHMKTRQLYVDYMANLTARSAAYLELAMWKLWIALPVIPFCFEDRVWGVDASVLRLVSRDPVDSMLACRGSNAAGDPLVNPQEEAATLRGNRGEIGAISEPGHTQARPSCYLLHWCLPW